MSLYCSWPTVIVRRTLSRAILSPQNSLTFLRALVSKCCEISPFTCVFISSFRVITNALSRWNETQVNPLVHHMNTAWSEFIHWNPTSSDEPLNFLYNICAACFNPWILSIRFPRSPAENLQEDAYRFLLQVCC